MDRERLDGWCEKIIAGLVLAILVYGPLATGAVRPQDFVVIQWLTVAALAVWAARFWINAKHRLLWTPLCWGVVAFLLYAVGRYVTADVEYVARQELVRILTYVSLFFIILNNLHRLELTQVAAMTLIALATLISVYGIYQYLADSNYVWHFLRPDAYRKRGSGTYICPNHMAGFLEMILPIALAYTLTGRFKHVAKILLGYGSLVIFMGITTSLSRGGWVATFAALLLFFCWMMRQRDYRLQSLLALIGFVIVGALFFWKAEFSRNRQEGLSVAGRTEDFRFRLWTPAVEMWKDHLWWGVGPNHYDQRYRQYRSAHNEEQLRPERVHNDYLNVLVDWGLAGFVLILGAWVLFFIGVARSWRFVQRTPNDLSSKRSNKFSFVMGATVGLLAILVHSFFDFNMHIPANAITAVTLMALVAGHLRFASERYWVTVRLPLRAIVTLVLGAALAYQGTEAWKHAREVNLLVRSEAERQDSARHLALLKQAFAVEPKNALTAYTIGETLRQQSWGGGDNYQALAEEALGWLGRAMALNRWDPFAAVRYGMCLDWIGKVAEAQPYFERAYSLDQNGYYIVAHLGWHHVQAQNYREARKWFERSLHIYWVDNPMAQAYLKIIDERLSQEAQSN